jgi:uncharacterized protein involved in exopolysaccharide biosynthesis
MGSGKLDCRVDGDIDLKNLFSVLMRRKITVLVTISFCLALALAYIFFTPKKYMGKVGIEIGEIVVNNSNNGQVIRLIDTQNDLKDIVERHDFSVKIPKGTSGILELSVESVDKVDIAKKLESGVKLVIDRHKEKAKIYENNNTRIRMTQQVGEIKISSRPVKPEIGFALSISLAMGLIFGTIAAFFREFLSL